MQETTSGLLLWILTFDSAAQTLPGFYIGLPHNWMKLSSFSWVYGFNQILIYMNSETYHEKPTGNSHGSPKPNKIILRNVEVVSCTAAQRKVLNICGASDMTQLLHPLSLSLASSTPHGSCNCFLLQTALWSSLACTKLDLFFPKQCSNLLPWGKVAWAVLCSG